MPFSHLTSREADDIAQRRLDAVEAWLRRLVDEELRALFGPDWLTAPDVMVKRDAQSKVARRRAKEPTRFARDVDALDFGDLIDILSNGEPYDRFFRHALAGAFPGDHTVIGSMLRRLLPIRNRRAHGSPLTPHQVERAVCYSDDIVEALKEHYVTKNKGDEYNAPRLLKIWDSIDNQSQLAHPMEMIDLTRSRPLYPGDVLVLHAEGDASFPDESYEITWQVANLASGESAIGPRLRLEVSDKHVGRLVVVAKVISRKTWHRFQNHDAQYDIHYKVLPPRE